MTILLILLGTYLGYLLLIGLCFFSFKYYFSEKIIRRKEFILLVFFPVIGLGNWRYNKTLRDTGKTKFPREWYIWRNIIYINIGYLSSLAIVGLYLFIATYNGLIGSDDLLVFFANMIEGALIVFAFLIALIGYIIIALFLILLPKTITNSIEKEFYKKQYKLTKKE